MQSADDVALSFVDSIPILDNLVYLFTEDPDPTFDVCLTTFNNTLIVLNENIEQIGTKVDQLSRTIYLSVIQNQVATDKREISNCFMNFSLYFTKLIFNCRARSTQILLLKRFFCKTNWRYSNQQTNDIYAATSIQPNY